MEIDFRGNQKSAIGEIQFTVTFNESELNLTETPFGMQIYLDGCKNKGEPGGPGFPSKIIRVAMPPLMHADSIDIGHSESILLITDPIIVAPQQAPQKSNDSMGHIIKRYNEYGIKTSSVVPYEPFVKPTLPLNYAPPIEELYRHEIVEARPIARLITTEGYGLVPVAVVEVNPIRYTSNALLEFYLQIDIKLTYMEANDSRRMVHGQKSCEQLLPINRAIISDSHAKRLSELARMQVINPEMVWDYSEVFSRSTVDYLIITDNHIWDESKIQPKGMAGDLVFAFQKLIEWKTKRGVKARLVTVSDIVYGIYGNFKTDSRDLQEVLRKFIKWAYKNWGISWLLLGGDVEIIPVRKIAGPVWAIVDLEENDPPKDFKSFWTGVYLKIKLSPSTSDKDKPDGGGCESSHILVNANTGSIIPYDPSSISIPSKTGWCYTTDSSYSKISSKPTLYIRVDGPEFEVKSRLQWLYEETLVPSDLYYAGLASPSISSKHDWDLNDNSIYGQQNERVNIDGAVLLTDISVGRSPVSSYKEAKAFMDKVITYEQFQTSLGSALSRDWPRRMLIVSENWWGAGTIRIPSIDEPNHKDYYYHEDDDKYTLIWIENPHDPTAVSLWNLAAEFGGASPAYIIPFDLKASTNKRGWYYAWSGTDLTPKTTIIKVGGTEHVTPLPSNWLVVFGNSSDLKPSNYIFNRVGPDASMRDQEELRKMISKELPAIDIHMRLYQDYIDADPSAAPLAKLTADRLKQELNSGPHFVSLSGHGNWWGCCNLGFALLDFMENREPFIVFADSCRTNRFDGESISKALITRPNGGAVAYVGYTRDGIIETGDDFQRGFFGHLKITQHLGLLNDARCQLLTCPGDGNYIWHILVQNLLGDPEMPVWIGSPDKINVSLLDISPFSVKVASTAGNPLPGASVHVQVDENTSIQTNSDASGIARFSQAFWDVIGCEMTAAYTGMVPYISKSPPVLGPVPRFLPFEKWGSYYANQMYPPETHFTGYIRGLLHDNSSSKELAYGLITNILRNDRVVRYIGYDGEGESTLELGEGYIFRIERYDSSGIVTLELRKDGKLAKKSVMTPLLPGSSIADKTFIYKKDFGGARDMAIAAIHLQSIIAWDGGKFVVVDGVWQISENAILI